MDMATFLSFRLLALKSSRIAAAAAAWSLIEPSYIIPGGILSMPKLLRVWPFFDSTISAALIVLEPISKPIIWDFLRKNMICSYLPKILSLSERLKPNANKILRWVSIRHGMPFSMRAIVMGDTLAFRASSVLLISKDSLTFFKELPLIKKP